MTTDCGSVGSLDLRTLGDPLKPSVLLPIGSGNTQSVISNDILQSVDGDHQICHTVAPSFDNATYVNLAGDRLEGKFDLKLDAEFFGQLRTTTFTADALWVGGELVPCDSSRYVDVLDGCHADSFTGPVHCYDEAMMDAMHAMNSNSVPAVYRGEILYLKEPKMRRLYHIYIINLHTDKVYEWIGVAESERAAEFKAFAKVDSDSGDIDGYQFVTKVVANVAERIEASAA